MGRGGHSRPQLTYARRWRRPTRSSWNHIVLGPGPTTSGTGPAAIRSAPIRFGSNTADWYRANVLRPWFAWYLHGKGDGTFPEAWVFEAGENQWHTFDAWPPKDVQPRKLYLRADGKLSFDPPPAGAGQYDAYISDPAHPVPYIPRPDDDSGWDTWLVQSQRFVDNRPDVPPGCRSRWRKT